ncbi:MAG: bifunctional riboflavin kinase/FAD synthetase [Candidatus Cloacimonadaceae bacterium]|nr:bifunctional riboflavin kinase/FAD synthetase [Candidatus Cloacimonadaceae bacterium]MDP3114524.1 bifunctional riboflavin kinase/FAD synthetase [Candidatus Cloacimonadaceae bacterium]
MKRCVISIGNFDGVHLGHRKLLERMELIAAERGLESVVITYDVPPAYTLKKDAKPVLLTPIDYKRSILKGLGIDRIEVIPFDEDFANTSADSFLLEYLIPMFNPQMIIVGYDSHFGHNREGDYRFLLEHARAFDYELEYIEPCLFGTEPISSTMIRKLLLSGDIETANELLTQPYRLFGKISRGLGIGRELGFPTANLVLDDAHQLIPKCGIYLSRVHLAAGIFFGLTNIGTSPTVKHSGIVEIETFVIDFDADVYDARMEIELLKYLREERMFDGKAGLIKVMHDDLQKARAIIGGAVS